MKEIPEEMFQECDDIDRLMYLYSEKSSHCEDTVSFWRRSIEAYCIVNNTLRFTSPILTEAFVRHDLIPTSAVPSINILVNRKEVLEVSAINSAKSINILETVRNTAVGWAVSVFTSIMKVSGPEKELVLSSLIRGVAEHIGKALAGKPDKDCVVFCSSRDALDEQDTFAGLMKRVAEAMQPSSSGLSSLLHSLDEIDLALLQNYLVAAGYAVRSADMKIIQLLRSESRKVATAATTSISEVEVGRLKLKNSIALLEKRVSDLEAKMDTYRSKAVQYKVTALCGYYKSLVYISLSLA
jgi:hypothetical protein